MMIPRSERDWIDVRSAKYRNVDPISNKWKNAEARSIHAMELLLTGSSIQEVCEMMEYNPKYIGERIRYGMFNLSETDRPMAKIARRFLELARVRGVGNLKAFKLVQNECKEQIAQLRGREDIRK